MLQEVVVCGGWQFDNDLVFMDGLGLSENARKIADLAGLNTKNASRCLVTNKINIIPIDSDIPHYSPPVYDMEFVLCAANKAIDGTLIASVRHWDPLSRKSVHALNLEHHFKGGHEQGFLTNYSRFIGRSEAWNMARQNGQITQQSDCNNTVLYSEDLY